MFGTFGVGGSGVIVYSNYLPPKDASKKPLFKGGILVTVNERRADGAEQQHKFVVHFISFGQNADIDSRRFPKGTPVGFSGAAKVAYETDQYGAEVAKIELMFGSQVEAIVPAEVLAQQPAQRVSASDFDEPNFDMPGPDDMS